jgi:hypothetical protein
MAGSGPVSLQHARVFTARASDGDKNVHQRHALVVDQAGAANAVPCLVFLALLLNRIAVATDASESVSPFPFSSLSKTIRQICDDDENMRRLMFRKGDLCEELPELPNDIFEKMRSRKTRSAVQPSVTQD